MGTEESVRPRLSFDSEQNEVILAESGARLHVEAGPGSGKTAVACARVGNLIRQGIEPANILLISFTRTAVQEMRDRIATFLDDPRDAAAVRITTVDSFSWRFWTGFLKNEIENAFLGYEATIAGALAFLKTRPPDLLDYLSQVAHVLIDEAQDLTSLRVALLNEILSCISPNCGVTVFSDPAQAIYGFTSKDEECDSSALSRVDIAPTWNQFERRVLINIHRTKDECLKVLWTEARPFLLTDQEFTLCERYRSVDGLIRSLGNAAPRDPLQQPADLNLFRWRADVLDASRKIGDRGVLHRLRMSDLPVCVEPWIGACFTKVDGRFVEADSFKLMWDAMPHALAPPKSMDDCWRELLRLARAPGKTSIDLQRLRSALSTEKPPVAVSMKEFGAMGPILSTIHASKGREADSVCVFLPELTADIKSDDVQEEARVLYVAATRPRRDLFITEPSKSPGFFLGAAGRVCRRCWGRDAIQVEFGREKDTEIDWRVLSEFGTDIFDASQEWLRSWTGTKPVPALLFAEPQRGFSYSLRTSDQHGIESGEGTILSVLPNQVNKDLRSVGMFFEESMFSGRKMRPSMRIGPVYVMGVRTVAFAPGDERISLLPEPYRSAGIVLAPLWWGYPEVYFKQWN